MLIRSFKYKCMQGFTLLEMMLVVGIMAIVSTVVVMNFQSGETRDRKLQTARFEMEQIRRALLKYKNDVGDFSKTSGLSPADFSFLLANPFVESDPEYNWSPDYRRGWRGPYLSGGDSGVVDVGGDLSSDGSGLPHVLGNFALGEDDKHRARGVPDLYAFAPVPNGEAGSAFSPPCVEEEDALDEFPDNDQCLLDWRFVGQDEVEPPFGKYGRPYLLFDLVDDPSTATVDESDDARIVSMGPNGKYDLDESVSCPPNPGTTDDIVLCLY